MRFKAGFEAVVMGWVLLWSAGCNKDAPIPVVETSSPYVIVSEAADPDSGRLAIDIKVPQPADEFRVRSVAESLINARKSGHRQIVIKTYLESVATSDMPYAISKLEDGKITHRFNSEASQQRIPTH
jgi:hypothetical protein